MHSIFHTKKSQSSTVTQQAPNHTPSPVNYDGRTSFSSEVSTLIDVQLPSYSASTSLPTYEDCIIVKSDMIDPEDQAWGSPPPSHYKWSLPRFSRKKQETRRSQS